MAACKFCNKDNLTWKDEEGKFRLFDSEGVKHDCDRSAMPVGQGKGTLDFGFENWFHKLSVAALKKILKEHYDKLNDGDGEVSPHPSKKKDDYADLPSTPSNKQKAKDLIQKTKKKEEQKEDDIPFD